MPEIVEVRDTRHQQGQGENADERGKNKAIRKIRTDLLMFMGYLLIRRSLLQQFLQSSMHMSYQRRDTHQCTHGEDHDGEEDGVGETHRRQIRCAIVTDHDRVRQTNHRRT